MYRGMESAQKGHLPVADMIAKKVICLPIYPNLNNEDLIRIISILKDR